MRQDLVEGFVAFVVCSLLWKQNFVTVFNNIENVDAGEKRASHGSAIKTRFISSRLSVEPASTSVVFRGIPFWSNPRTRLFPSSIHDSNQNWSSKGFFCCLMNITSNRLAFLTCAMVLKPTRRHDRRIESIEHTLALRNVTLADLEEYVKQQEFSSLDGQLLWKIPDYARKRNDAVTGQQVSFDSPCFYTSRHGYKMCARIYLNGDGIGKGTHISIFFGVMRSQYDALLRWPFRQKVTFMLLDQDNVEHVIDAFRPDPNSSSFQRPRKETDITSGCPMFCSLAELNNHAYVRDDTMFVKVIVDTDDL